MDKLSYVVKKVYTRVDWINRDKDLFNEVSMDLGTDYTETVSVARDTPEERKRLIMEVAQRLAGMNHHAFQPIRNGETDFYYKLILSKLL